MPIFFYSKPIIPETCFEISKDTELELGKVQFRVRPEAIGLVAVEAESINKAKKIGARLVEDEMKLRAPK